MLTQLALLPLLAITVTGVTSETNDSDVVVEVATSEPVPARVARPMVGPHLLYVFVDGATPADAVFKNGAHPIVARTRSRYTKLEVPLDPGCAAASRQRSRPCRRGFAWSSPAARTLAQSRRPKGR